jgi:hypothetical protein
MDRISSAKTAFVASFTVRIILKAIYVINTFQFSINECEVEYMICLIQLINPNTTRLVCKSRFFYRFTTFFQNVLGGVSYRNKVITTAYGRDIRALGQHTCYVIRSHSKKRKD